MVYTRYQFFPRRNVQRCVASIEKNIIQQEIKTEQTQYSKVTDPYNLLIFDFHEYKLDETFF